MPRKKQTNPAEETPAPKRKTAPRKRAAKKTDADAKPKARSSARTTSSRKKTANDPKGPTLLIVESPTKAKTLGKYLGPGYKILASFGHVRDLPRRRKRGEEVAGIDIPTWTPTYVVHDVVHCCIPNLPSNAARTATIALSNALIPYLLEIGEAGSINDALWSNGSLRSGVYVYRRHLTKKSLASMFGMPHRDIELLIASGI